MAWGFDLDCVDLRAVLERCGLVAVKEEAARRLLDQGLLSEEDLA